MKYWALLGLVSLAGFVLVAVFRHPVFRHPVSRLFADATGADPDPAAGAPDQA